MLPDRHRESVFSNGSAFASFDHRRSLTSSENSEIEQVQSVAWGGFIFLPFNSYWQGIVGITTMFIVFASIYDFVYTNVSPPLIYIYIRVGCDFIYLLDTVLYTLHRHLTSIQVTRVYLPKSPILLFIDYVTLLPMDLFYQFVVINKEGHSDNIQNILRINVVIRAYRLQVFFAEKNIISTDVKQTCVIIGSHLLLQLLISHVFAAIWYSLRCYNCKELTWTFNMMNKDFDPENKFSWFLWSFYFVVGIYSHNYSVDIRSENITEKFVTIILKYLAISVTYGLLYGKLIVAKLECNRRQISFADKIENIKRYMQNWDASRELQIKTFEYYEAFWKHRSAVQDAIFFQKLPLALQKEVNLDIFWEALIHSHLFCNMDMSFKRSICLNMKSEFLLPGEFVYKYGALKTKMIYIVTGVIQVLSDEDFESPVASFSSGTLLGETSIILPVASTANVMCASYCEIHTLDIRGLFDALKNYPKKTKQLLSAVRERVSIANSAIVRAKLYSKHSSKLESMELDKTTLHNETKWLKERYRRTYRKQSEEEEMDYEDEDYWKVEEEKSAEEVIQHTSKHCDLYAFSDEVELKTDIICLKTTFPWILEPESSFLKFWDWSMLLIVFTVCMLIPYYVAFLKTFHNQMINLHIVIILVYIVDIWIQCTTAIKTKEVIVTDFCAICRYRLKQISFLIDLISALPFTIILHFMVQLPAYKSVKGSLTHILRVYKLFVFIHKKESSLWADITTVRILKYVLMYVISGYWVASLLYMVACPEQECRDLSWYGVGKKIDKQLHSKLVDFDSDFVVSLFYSFSLVTTMGINNVYPQNTTDALLCLFCSILSLVLGGYSYSELTATYITQTKQRVNYQALIAEMNHFSNESKLGSILKHRIQHFLIFQWLHSKGSYMTLERDLLDEAPTEIKESIVNSKIIELLKQIPLFQEVNPEFLNMVVKIAKCHALPAGASLTVPGVRTTTLIIVRKGYCVLRSKLVGDTADGREVIAGPGCHFPVVEFLHRIPVFVSVTSITCCEIISFEYRDIMNTMKLYATVYKEIDDVLKQPDMDMHHLKYDTNDSMAVSKVRERNKHIASFLSDADDDNMRLAQYRKQYLQPFLALGRFQYIRYLMLRAAIHPQSRFIRCWEISRAFFAVCTLFITPMIYCALAPYREVRILGYALDVTAYIDLFVRFHVGYYTEQGILVSHPLYTAHHYLTHAFFIDFFGCFPFVFIKVQLLFGSDHVVLLHYALLISRAFQVYRFIGLCKYLESDIRRVTQYITMFRMLILLLILWHYIANFITFSTSTYKFADDDTFEGIEYSTNKWFTNTKLFQLEPKDTLQFYSFATYFVASTFINCMTGAFQIRGNDGMVFMIIMGTSLFFIRLIFFASISSMNMVGNINLTKYQERMKSLVSFLRNEDTEEKLLKKAIDNFEHDWSITRGTNVYSMFSKFHSALHEEVTYKLYSATLKAVNIFSGADEVFYRTVSKHVKVVHQKRGAVIIKFNQFEDTIYIINKGRVEIRLSDTFNEEKTLKQGCIFGNLHLFKCPARHTAIAHHTVELLAIPNTLFYSILDDHQLIKEKFLMALGENSGYIGTLDHATTEEQQNAGLRNRRFNFRMETLIRNLWTTDMLIYKIFTTFFNLLASHISVIIILYHIGLKANGIYWQVLIYSFDIIFLLKIFVGFHTAYEDKITGVVVRDLRLIAKRYLKTWFLIDLISLLPLEMIALLFYYEKHKIEASFWLKLNRTLRLLFMAQFFNSNLKRVNVSNYMRLVQAFFWTTLIIQVMTCVYMMVACYDEHCYKTASYFDYTLVPTKSDTEQALVAQTYIMTLFMGTDSREVSATNLPQIGFVVVCSIIFLFLSAFTICCIASFIEITNLSKYNYKHEVLKLKDYLQDRDLSSYLLSKTIRYALQLWLRAKGEWLPVLLQEAPTYLREDLMSALYLQHLRKNMLFSGTDEDFLSQLAAKFDRCVFFPGDYIVEKGDVDGNMYFIHDGEVEVVHRNKYFVETLIERIKTTEVFSMAQGLYKNKPHIHIYRAKTVVDLLILNCNKCQEIYQMFPEAVSYIYGKAQEIDFTL